MEAVVIDLTLSSDDEPSPPPAKRIRVDPPPIEKPECGCGERPLDAICYFDCCNHSSCRACLARAVDAAIGTGAEPRCPGCQAALGQHELQQLDDPARLERLERAQLQAALPTDMLECPKCAARWEASTERPEPPKAFDGCALNPEAAAHFAAHRFRCPACKVDFCRECKASPYHLGKTCAAASAKSCRFCGDPATAWHGAGDLCGAKECKLKAQQCCLRVLACGHPCGGVKGEANCLPCLQCSGGRHRQFSDDFCNICFVEALGAAPAVELGCGHIFHRDCLLKRLKATA